MNITPIVLKLCEVVDDTIEQHLLAWINTILLYDGENDFSLTGQNSPEWEEFL